MNIFVILLLVAAVQSESSCSVKETISEYLKIISLNNHDVLTSFNFTIVGEATVDQQDFLLHVPGLIINLFQHYGVESLRLSLTQGFWRSNIWGLQQLIDVPSGTFLLVKFRNNESIDARWCDLLNQLNGIFCSSILNMDPALTSTPKMLIDNQDLLWRYGALSSETVCSENLKPWKKLLPCKQHGLVSLLEPRNLLSSDFHSISLTIEERLNALENSAKWHLYFSANTVHSERKIEKNYWSLHTLFGRNLLTKCNVMDHSAIFVEKKPFWKIRLNSTLNVENTYDAFDLTKWVANGEFPLMVSIIPQNQLSNDEPSHAETALNVHTFFSSMNQVSGRITSRIFNPYSTDIGAIFSHMIPWQIRTFLHTLRFSCRIRAKQQFEHLEPLEMSFTLAKDGKRPLLYELRLRLPAESSCKVVVDYETAFLKITDFPADANSGVVVPGPMLSLFVPNESDYSQKKEEFNLTSWNDQGLVRLHGEPLLILLPVPDFSMPFNVICLVCTSIAIFYGNVVTMTTKLMKPVFKKAASDEDTRKKEEDIKSGLIRRLLTRIGKMFSKKSKEETEKKD